MTHWTPWWAPRALRMSAKIGINVCFDVLGKRMEKVVTASFHFEVCEGSPNFSASHAKQMGMREFEYNADLRLSDL
jgi:hypothetical protein